MIVRRPSSSSPATEVTDTARVSGSLADLVCSCLSCDAFSGRVGSWSWTSVTRLFEQWDTARHTFVLEVARALACIEEWRRVHPRFVRKSLAARAKSRHPTRSKSTPTPTIFSSLKRSGRRSSTSRWKRNVLALPCHRSSRPGATNDWLKQVYEERYSSRLEQLLRSAHFRGDS